MTQHRGNTDTVQEVLSHTTSVNSCHYKLNTTARMMLYKLFSLCYHCSVRQDKSLVTKHFTLVVTQCGGNDDTIIVVT